MQLGVSRFLHAMREAMIALEFDWGMFVTRYGRGLPSLSVPYPQSRSETSGLARIIFELCRRRVSVITERKLLASQRN